MPLYAQETFDIVSPLTFGSFGITANDAAYDLTISHDNNLTHDNAFIVSSPAPSRGEMLLENLPPATEVIITFDNGTMVRDGGPSSPDFDIVDFTTNQPTPLQFVTTGAGTLTVYFGATLRTSGNGQVYRSGPYSGSYDITIDF